MKGVSGAPAGRLGRSPLACGTQQSAVGDACQHGCDVPVCLQPRQRETAVSSISSPDTALDLVQQGRSLAACTGPDYGFDLSPDSSRFGVSWVNDTTERCCDRGSSASEREDAMMGWLLLGGETRDWRPGRRSQPRPPEHTPWTPVFLSPSAKQGKGWTERPGSCACRLASSRFLPSGFGEIAQTGPGRPPE